MSFSEDLKILLKAKVPCIWIKTYEEEKVIQEIRNIIAKEIVNMKIKVWDLASGVASIDLITGKMSEKKFLPGDVVINKHIADNMLKQDKSYAWILKDLQLITNLPAIIRGIRNIAESKEIVSYNPIIAISPLIDIPIIQDKEWAILDYETPSKQDLNLVFHTVKTKLELKKKNAVKPSDLEIEIPSEELISRCVDLSYGLTLQEVQMYIKKSLLKYRTLNSNIFYDARQDLIKKTGILELQECHIDMNNMGGNVNFKNWISDIEVTFSPEAQEFGVEKSKGFLALGVPGQPNVV